MAPTPKNGRKRPATASKSSAKQRAKPVPPLPDDWPVNSKPPSFAKDKSALRPGSLLRQVCSGQDIHLARQVVPNIDKEKGRFLIIMPGQLSLQAMASGGPTPKKPKSTQDTDDNMELTQDTLDEDALEATQSSVSASSKPSLPQLGRVEGLRTKTPKLRVQFPNSNKSLVFPGTKVETTSKYMWLNCSSKKKGTVMCKNIFTSAIVFGQPTWEGNDENEDAASTPLVSQSQGDEEPEPPMVHYGGSDRTTDGVAKGKKHSSLTHSDETEHVPIISRDLGFDNRGLPIRPAMLTSSPKPIKEYVVEEVQSSDEDDDDEEFRSAATVDPSSARSRTAPKRQASKKATKYTADLLDSDEDEDDSSEEEDEDKESKPAKKATTTKTAKTTAVKPKAPAKKSKPTKKTTVLTIESSSEEDSFSMSSAEEDNDAPPAAVVPRTSRGRRSSTTKKPDYQEPTVDDSDLEAQESEDEVESESTPTEKKTGTKRKRPTQQVSKTKSKSTPKSSKETPKPTAKKAKTSQVKPKAAVARKSVSEKPNDASKAKKEVATTPSSTVTSPSGQSSPFRSRRKKSVGSSNSKPAAKKVVDLSFDDNFSF